MGERFGGCGGDLVGVGVSGVDCDVGCWGGVLWCGREELAGYLEGAAAIVICNRISTSGRADIFK